jgi:hypothetical protein
MPTEICSSPVEATCSNFGLLMMKVLRLCAKFGSRTRIRRWSSARGTRPRDRASANEVSGTVSRIQCEGLLLVQSGYSDSPAASRARRALLRERETHDRDPAAWSGMRLWLLIMRLPSCAWLDGFLIKRDSNVLPSWQQAISKAPVFYRPRRAKKTATARD